MIADGGVRATYLPSISLIVQAAARKFRSLVLECVNMGVEVPPIDELLELSAPASYGDTVLTTAGSQPWNRHRGGALHLSAVLPALSAAIGHPIATAVHHDPVGLQHALGFPGVASAIVVLVDGLGYWNIKMRLGHAPFLRSLLENPANDRPISTCFPSTTVAAMASFGTGTCPGLTGMTGYTQLNPVTGKMSQLIQFRDAMQPRELQRQPTIFESLSAQGVRVTSCGQSKFEHSPLTKAALRGAEYMAGDKSAKRVLDAAARAATPGLTYLYMSDTDKVGHAYGWQSERWVTAFEGIDAQLKMLHESAPAGTLIVIIADHGMISSDPEQRIDIAQQPELTQGVALVGGEPRAVMLYAENGANPESIAARWRATLGQHAVVRTRSEAIDEGMFGVVDQRVIPMIGDVLVTATQRVTIVDSRIQTDKATRLPSVHGSLSSMELDIPCLVDVA